MKTLKRSGFNLRLLFAILLCSVLLSGCSKDKEGENAEGLAPEETLITGADESGAEDSETEELKAEDPKAEDPQAGAFEEEKIVPNVEVSVDKNETEGDAALKKEGDKEETEAKGGADPAVSGGTENADPSSEPVASAEEPEAPAEEPEAGEPEPVIVVWLGDSLTQGSLGDLDDNLANAPYERLKKLCADRNVTVEGHGYYGYFTRDIFSTYIGSCKDGKAKDPSKVFVIWVGSNDYSDPGEDRAEMIARVDREIDNFVGNEINKYIVVSHPPRVETVQDDYYKVVNEDLKNHYGDRFLDITSCAPFPEGLVGDGIHLNQQAYDKVADAVYNKLAAMGYI